MATYNPLPADIIFAQKASACVKAAGLDPKSLDLKKFTAMAVTIFTRAYQGIYKEYEGIISDPQNEGEQASNAQKVINGLFKKTGNDALNEIVGHDVVCGSHKAIGILVGILYAEGNRLWQEKLNRVEASKVKSQNDDMEALQKKKKPVKKSKKRRVKKTEETVPESDAPADVMHEGTENSVAVSVPVTMIHESSSQAAQEGRGAINDGHREEYRGGAAAAHHGVEGVPVRRIRPKSAPSQRISSSQAAACNRLYRHDNRHRKAVDAHVAVHGHVKPWQADNMPPPVPGASSPINRKQQQQVSDPPIIPVPQEQPHTYDPTTGRRITLVEYHAKMAELQKKRVQDAVGNLKHGSDLDDQKGNNPATDQNHNPLPPVPTKPVWPGKSTGNSVDKWVQRMTVARVGAEPVDPNATPRYYKAYNLLEKMDLVISVEHCFNCIHHCAVIITTLPSSYHLNPHPTALLLIHPILRIVPYAFSPSPPQYSLLTHPFLSTHPLHTPLNPPSSHPPPYAFSPSILPHDTPFPLNPHSLQLSQ